MDPIWLVLLGVVVAAQAVETTLGFGATVIALSVGSQFVPLRELVVALVLIAIVQSSWLAIRGRHHIQWRVIVTRITPFVALGLPVGIWCGTVVNDDTLRMILGGLVVALSIKELVMLLLRRKSDVVPHPAVGAGYLIGGGFFHGLFATGGPLIVLYAGRRIPEKTQFRSTLAVLWLFLGSIMLGTFLVQGRIEQSTFVHAGVLLPALVAGILLGEVLHTKAPQRAFQALVHVLLLFVGMMLFI